MKKQLFVLSLVVCVVLTISPITYAKSSVNVMKQTNDVQAVMNLQNEGLPAPGYIKGDNVPFKSRANDSSVTLGIFEFGEEVVVNYFTGNWVSVYRIETGQYGYVNKRYISFGAV
ncbi:hypothetical protein SH1V18_16480 [Vallitalea longa]|uniref:SH3b domain-containing protein n=1 Tax=Vallitalea longa TaxID=2936439 RepID=A0A9W5YB69_9FIRM|nr:hypothetical protein [Vallitalea longa]GKX29168.1 hypothetical protein SH1V18_16480 [Vallitalea longa]